MPVRLDVGGVIRRVWEIYIEQAPILMPAAAAVFVVTGLIAAVLESSGTLLGDLVAIVISLAAGTVFAGIVAELVADVRNARRDSSVGRLLRAIRPVTGQLILVGIAYGFTIVAGLLAFIFPGLILLTVWFVFAPVIVLERPPGMRALARSRELVSGNGWRVFAVLMVLFVLVFVLSAAIEETAISLGTGVAIVVRVVVGVLTAPFPALAAAVVYFDLRDASASNPSARDVSASSASASDVADDDDAPGSAA